MHKIKNKKIISMILGGLVVVSTTSSYIYANEAEIENSISINLNESEDVEGEEDNGDSNDEGDVEEDDNGDVIDEEVTPLNLVDVAKEENLGKKVKVTGIVESIENNVVIIKDSSGKAGLFLNNIETEDIIIGDNITAIGKIENIDNSKYVVVYNSSDIETKHNNDDKGEEGDLEDGDKNEKPESNNQSSSLTKPNQTVTGGTQNGLGNSNSISLGNTTTVKKVYARSYVTISTYLTSSQWKKVKSALEEGLVKVVDLPNNKIRIKYVSNGYGDKVWIVNDPRGLDEEVEVEIKAVGFELAKTISYKDYDIAESSWNSILEDIEEGNAKLKVLDDENLKVIYNKSSKVDTTKIITKK